MTTTRFIRLLKRIHNGDTEALSPIYQEYAGKMLVSARYILRNEADAQDAVADAMVKLLKYAQANENPRIDNAGAYMNRAVKNAAIDIYHKKTEIVFSEVIEEITPTRDSADSVIDRVGIQQVLSAFAEQDREIALRFYFYDYKIKQIAQELDIPEGTVKWKLSEIRKKLFEKLR